MLELTDLRFRRPGINFHFDLRLTPGERVAVMGGSGSGKSTLLDLIAGFAVPLSGSLTFDGADLLKQRVSERPVTLLSQSDNLLPHLGVFENAALGISLKSGLTPTEHAAVGRALAGVGLQGFENRLPAALSGGQQQRCALARTMLRDKPLLLLDEPFSALDQGLRTNMAQLVNRIVTSRNLSLITVTHDPNDAALLSDRILHLRAGRLA